MSEVNQSPAPSPFSKGNPRLQRAWDATSFSALMRCPRYYQYTIIEGRRGSNVDLEFGVLVHTSIEAYAKARLDGLSKDEATLVAVRCALEDSVSYDGEGNPVFWGGSYLEQWRCLGTEKYRNKKGNAAKCPWSHKGKWFMHPVPSVCGECGSDTETQTRWVPFDAYKHRESLVRLVAWYCFEQPEEMGEGLTPFKFPDGTHAVELPFRLPLQRSTPDGEPYILCGYLDGIKEFSQDLFISDLKTTKKTLGKAYWDTFQPHVQMDIYDLAGSILFPDLDLKGVIIEGAQVLVSGNRFGLGIYYRNEAQREEVLDDLYWWLGQAERYAEEGHWPMNRAMCWICPFKKICSKEPDKRQMYLDADFEVSHWNPLEER